jgi:hypothetical protein
MTHKGIPNKMPCNFIMEIVVEIFKNSFQSIEKNGYLK